MCGTLHRELKVTWTKSGGCLTTCKVFDQPKPDRRHKASCIGLAAPYEPDRWCPGIRRWLVPAAIGVPAFDGDRYWRQPVGRHLMVIGTGGLASDVRRRTGGNRPGTDTRRPMASGEPARNRHPMTKFIKFIYTCIQGGQVRIWTLHLLVKSQWTYH